MKIILHYRVYLFVEWMLQSSLIYPNTLVPVKPSRDLNIKTDHSHFKWIITV